MSTENSQQITKDSVEQAFCFFHQKWRVYEHSTMDWQKDDIEYAISQYVEEMNTALYSTVPLPEYPEFPCGKLWNRAGDNAGGGFEGVIGIR